MSEMVPFLYGATDNPMPVRVVLVDEQPWFVAADVCRALGLRNVTKALAGLDDDENTLTVAEGIHAGAGNPTVNIVSESGLYALIFRSRKEAARKFRRWVTGEVLPAIRKQGNYAMQQPRGLAAPASLIEALLHRHDQRVLEVARYLATHWPQPPWLSEVVDMAGLSRENVERALKLLRALEVIDLPLRTHQPPQLGDQRVFDGSTYTYGATGWTWTHGSPADCPKDH